MLRRFLLWDIDGTLLTSGSIGRLALERGTMLAASLDAVPSVTMSGKTDPQIVRDILEAAGVPEAEASRLAGVALAEAERVLAAQSGRMLAEGKAHSGVRDLLEALSVTEGVSQSLLTGNTRPNALVKVRTFGLDAYFDLDTGAYGSDHPDRDRLVPIALERARELRGLDFQLDEVWVIGDTPRDLRCARAAGVRCLIVGTNRHLFDAVRDLAADAFVSDLSNTAQVRRILLS